jgi:hypothetical protein
MVKMGIGLRQAQTDSSYIIDSWCGDFRLGLLKYFLLKKHIVV